MHKRITRVNNSCKGFEFNSIAKQKQSLGNNHFYHQKNVNSNSCSLVQVWQQQSSTLGEWLAGTNDLKAADSWQVPNQRRNMDMKKKIISVINAAGWKALLPAEGVSPPQLVWLIWHTLWNLHYCIWRVSLCATVMTYRDLQMILGNIFFFFWNLWTQKLQH